MPRYASNVGYRYGLRASMLLANPSTERVAMIPDPLHPAVVHFPIVLVFLLPIFALAAIRAIHRGSATARAWAVPVALSAALALSSWVAVQTGGAQEDRVEDIVPSAALDAHEDAAELFLTLSGVLVLVAGAGFLPGMLGRTARVAAAAGAVGLVAVGANVGHSGGELVYRHGAASAYTHPNGAAYEAANNARGSRATAHLEVANRGN
jgi:uncharacterized membrane protein